MIEELRLLSVLPLEDMGAVVVFFLGKTEAEYLALTEGMALEDNPCIAGVAIPLYANCSAMGLPPGAMEQLQEYNETVKPEEMPEVTVPPEVRSKMKSFKITAAFADEVDGLRLPQFVIPMTDITMFDNAPKLLTAEDLYKGFSFRGKNAEIDFANIDAEIARVDSGQGNGRKNRPRRPGQSV